MTKTGVLNWVVARTISVLLVTTVTAGTTCADSANIEAVKRQTLSFVREIHSIEFESVLMGNDVNRESGERMSRKETMRYFQSGSMFRSETGITLNGESLGDEISTYTGERFQVLHRNIETMTLKDESLSSNPARAVSPLVGVFSFLAKRGMSFTWVELTAEKNIEDTFKHAKYVGKRELNGAECVVLEFPGVFPSFTVEVWFSQEKNYFPVKSISFVNGLPMGGGETKKLHGVTLDSGTRVFIPVEIVSTFNYPGRSLYRSSEQTVTIDPRTIKINHEIDDDFFTLPTTIARHVRDIDPMIGEGTFEILDNYVIEEERKISPLTTVVIIINIVFVLLILYRLYLTKFKRHI